MGRDADEHYPRSFKKNWVGCNNKSNPYRLTKKKNNNGSKFFKLIIGEGFT